METTLFLNYDDKEISETEFEAYCRFLKAQFRVFEKEKMSLSKKQTNNSLRDSMAFMIWESE